MTAALPAAGPARRPQPLPALQRRPSPAACESRTDPPQAAGGLPAEEGGEAVRAPSPSRGVGPPRRGPGVSRFQGRWGCPVAWRAVPRSPSYRPRAHAGFCPRSSISTCCVGENAQHREGIPAFAKGQIRVWAVCQLTRLQSRQEKRTLWERAVTKLRCGAWAAGWAAHERLLWVLEY